MTISVLKDRNMWIKIILIEYLLGKIYHLYKSQVQTLENLDALIWGNQCFMYNFSYPGAVLGKALK